MPDVAEVSLRFPDIVRGSLWFGNGLIENVTAQRRYSLGFFAVVSKKSGSSSLEHSDEQRAVELHNILAFLHSVRLAMQ